MVGDLIEPRRQPVGVLRSHRVERPEDNQVERALQQLDLLAVFT
jgi:hypothetical protein